MGDLVFLNGAIEVHRGIERHVVEVQRNVPGPRRFEYIRNFLTEDTPDDCKAIALQGISNAEGRVGDHGVREGLAECRLSRQSHKPIAVTCILCRKTQAEDLRPDVIDLGEGAE
ncbi:hypothetical protein G5B91_35325 (plasmid) [Pseudomonas nitroreducens]|uniref:Uncharacterized protein n=1 Tax=Pseudomonas nitroreducens TaxID=46680 RepID=A0A6G6J8K5_PSENT|nr:hypothetical protein G5B91_35325 [Pseudomonas nitroreducens]